MVEQLLRAAAIAVCVWRAGMKTVHVGVGVERGVLHEGHSAALHRVGDDHLRLAGMLFTGAQRRRECVEVVPVAALDMPAETSELRRQIAEVAGLANAIV